MEARRVCKWPATTICCLNEALTPYRHQNLSNRTGKPEQIYDILHLFIRLVRTAHSRGYSRTRSATKTTARESWQRLCTALLKQKHPCKSELKIRNLQRLMRIQVEGLWMIVRRNIMIYGPRRLSIDTVERWLIACVRKSLVYDTGNVLRESLDRMEAPDPILLDPPSNYEETNDDQGGVIFPEMSHALRNLRASEPQYEDCVEGTFRFFLKLAYAALDMYTFYRSHVNDPEPCECRLAYGASEYIKMLDYNPYSQLCFPTYLSWTLSNVNLRGSFDFLFKQILPSFYSILSTQPEYLGYKLYEWLLDAAKQSRSDWDDRIYDVILHAHRPDRLMMAERYNFRHRGADVEFPIAYFDRRRAAAEYLRNAGEFVDVPLIPYGPLIDIGQYSSSIASLRPSTAKTDHESDCTICQFPLREEACIKLHTCEHRFHTACITAWANTRTITVTCPICRAYICVARRTRLGCMYCE